MFLPSSNPLKRPLLFGVFAALALCLTALSPLVAQNGGDPAFELFITPDQVIQGESDMEFTATATDRRELVSFSWTNILTGESLGDSQTLILAPEFPFSTPISCIATDANGGTGVAFATILVDNEVIDVTIDPEWITQEEDEDMRFRAIVDHEVPIASYTWRRAGTLEVIGEGEEIFLPPTFENSTIITVTVTDTNGDQGFASAYIEVPFIDPNQGAFEVEIEPGVAYIDDEPVTFTLDIDHDQEIASYEWSWLERGTVLGTDATLTLQPDPANVGTLIVSVTDVLGDVGNGFALVLPEDRGSDLRVTIDPPFVIQGEDPITLNAIVDSQNAIESYTWTNDNTGEIIGTEASITLDPMFTDVTIISVKVFDIEGEDAEACAIITPDNVPIGDAVFINPGFVIQEDAPMTFEAVVDPALEVSSYTWINLNNDEQLGTEASITLAPEFDVTTTLGLRVVTADQQTYTAQATIYTDDFNDGLDVDVDPEVQFQGDTPMTFTATVEDAVGDVTFEWVREDTFEVIGDTASITLEPTFTEVTAISVTVTDSEGSVGYGWGLILLERDGNPNGGGGPFVFVDPPVVNQADQPMTFTAILENAEDEPTFTWTNENTGDVLGNTASITLDPNFTETTSIRVDVNVDGVTVSSAALILVIAESFTLAVDPPAVIQNGQEVTFNAVFPDDQTITAFEWRNRNTDEVIGTEASLTLTLDFAVTTTLSLKATNDAGVNAFAGSLILVDDQNSEFFPMLIDPTVSVQGLQPLSFTAQVPDTVTVTSYEWRNFFTGETLGTGATFTASEVFQETTILELEADAEGNRESIAFATILVYPGGVDPNGDGVNNVDDIIFEASQRWLNSADVRTLSTINTGQ